MGEVIEKLFAVLPFFFLVTWVLRLVSRKKTALKTAANKQNASVHPPGMPDERMVEPVSPVPGDKPARVLQSPVIDNQGERDVKSLPSRKNIIGKQDVVAGVENIAPLAQGMIWSVILGKPVSLSEPDQ